MIKNISEANQPVILFTALCLLTLMQVLLMSHAKAGLIINSITEFDAGNSVGQTDGSFSLTSGGAINTSTFAGDTASQDALVGDITQVGDGISFISNALDIVDNEYLVGLDATISIENTHLSAIYEVIFDFSFMNLVSASGSNAYADSEFYIEDNNGDEIFATDIFSDSQPSEGIIGGTVSENGTQSFTYTINPGDLIELTFFFTQEGEALPNSGLSTSEFEQSFLLSSLNVTNNPPDPVSAPNSIMILLLGLSLILAGRTKLN